MKKYKEILTDTIVSVQKEMSFENKMQVPVIKKIVLSVGAGKFFKDKTKMADLQKALSYIACQHACLTKAKKSVSAFEVREGMETGMMVTLRKDKMNNFIDRLIYLYLPRLREFKGFDSKSFNKNSFSFGIKNVFECCDEIKENMNRHDLYFGMNVTFVFSNINVPAQELFMRKINFPFIGKVN